jgi:hypothetical protein
MTRAMQQIISWYVVGVVLAASYGWVRIREAGGLREGIRQRPLWRNLVLLILGVLGAPFAVMLIGVIVFMVFMWASGNSIR